MFTKDKQSKPVCPQCGEETELYLSVVLKHDEIANRKSNWKLFCLCGFEQERRLSLGTRMVATLLYLAPIISTWGIFLFYAERIHPDRLRFVVWLFHIAPGVLIGDRLSKQFTMATALAQIKKLFPEQSSYKGKGMIQ